MLKISTKMTLWYMLATAVVITTTAFSLYIIYEEQRRASIDEDLHDFADFLTIGLGAKSTELSDLFDEMVERKDKPSIRQKTHRFVLASNDSLIFESNVVPNLDSMLSELEDRNEFSFSSIYNTISLNNTEYRTYTRPLKLRPKKEYKLIIFTSMDKLYESLSELRTIIFIVLPISLLFSGAFGFFIARRSLAPIRSIAKTAESISSSSLEMRVPIGKTEDELSKLALTFNAMIARLDDTFKSQKQFIADASHDLRTPLTVIQMELELLLLSDKPDPGTKVVIDRCLKEIFRLNELADNLMLLARADAHQLKLNKKIYRLDEQLLECITQMKNLAQAKGISFRLNIGNSAEIYADDSMIRRAIVNAIDNAIKYSPENEIIDIALSAGERLCEIMINNKGNPIPAESLTKIFNRFQRGEKSRTSSGFGLGLAIIKTVAQVHGGNVYLESDSSNGTTLRFSIPGNENALS